MMKRAGDKIKDKIFQTIYIHWKRTIYTIDKTKIYYRFCDPIVDIYLVFSCYYDVSSQKLN